MKARTVITESNEHMGKYRIWTSSCTTTACSILKGVDLAPKLPALRPTALTKKFEKTVEKGQ